MSAALTLLLAVTFSVAAIAKLRDPRPFVATLRALVPGPAAAPLARAVPIGELLLAALLVTGLAPRVAALLALVALAVFSVALSRLRQDPSLPGCNCFGGGVADPQAGLVRNGLLGLAALALVAWPMDGALWTQSAAALAGAVTVAVGAACVWQLGGALVSTLRLVRS
jgi:uncharacterized membrane protein YphA (DoxX/SURF4 family)